MESDSAGDNGWEIVKKEELQRVFDEGGVAKIDEFVRKSLQQWKNVEVNIAVTGDSGVGKSSFTNAIRDWDNDEVLQLIHKFSSSSAAQFLVYRAGIYMSLVNLAGLASSLALSDSFVNMNTLVLQFTFGALKGKDS